MKDICIFTPTYNRAHTLPRLYQSLCEQDASLFYWLIVDDGSTDDTEELVQELSEEAPFSITYIKQKNGGKQRAWNAGVEACKAELFMCVDSDDRVAPNALRILWDAWIQVQSNPKIAGIFGLCGREDGTPYTGYLPDKRTTKQAELYQKYKYKGDIAIATKTEVLKRYPFELDDNENFISENYVFLQIDDNFEYTILNDVLTVIEYQPDGYSENVRKVTRQNPKSYMTIKRMWFERSDRFKDKMENTVLFLVGALLAKQRHPLAIAPSKSLAVLGLLPAWILTKTVYKE